MAQQTSRASHGMSVRVFWGDKCIHSEFVPPSRRAPYCVGRLPPCDVELPLPRSYAPLQPLIQWEDDEPFFQPRTQLGPFAITVTATRAPRAVRWNGPLDYRWWNVLLLCVAVAGVFLVSLKTHEASFDEDVPPGRQADIQRWVVPKQPETKMRVPVSSTPQRLIRVTQRRERQRREGRDLSDVRHLLGGSLLLGAGMGQELEAALQGLRNANASSSVGPGGGLRGDNRGGRLGAGITIGDLGLPGARLGKCDTPDCGPLLRKGKGPALDPFPQEPPRIVCSVPGAGCLDKELIRASIRKAKSAIRACYEYALTTKPNLAGKITARFTFGADGVVTGAEASESSIDDAPMTRCVLNRIRGIAFPRSTVAAQYTVHYPFVFKQ